MTPSWRKPVGALIIVGLIIVWCVVVASASATVWTWHWTLQLVFYVVTGIVWITPMKPLLRWMER
jgi:hypothetical protein